MDIIEEVALIIYEALGLYPDSGKSMRIARRINQLYEPRAKKLLLSISKESKRMDGTTYLVPDYTKFREAIKEAGIRE